MAVTAVLAGVAATSRAVLAASVAILGHVQWIWIPAVIVLESASMAALAGMQRRLLAAGGASVGSGEPPDQRRHSRGTHLEGAGDLLRRPSASAELADTFQQFIIGHSTMIPDAGTPRSARPGKPFRRSPAGADLPQGAWLRLGSHSRDDLLELADEAGLAAVIRAHLVHELVPTVGGARPRRGTSSLGRSIPPQRCAACSCPCSRCPDRARAITGRLVPAMTHRGLPPLQRCGSARDSGGRRALVDDAGKTRGLLHIDQEREQHR